MAKDPHWFRMGLVEDETDHLGAQFQSNFLSSRHEWMYGSIDSVRSWERLRWASSPEMIKAHLHCIRPKEFDHNLFLRTCQHIWSLWLLDSIYESILLIEMERRKPSLLESNGFQQRDLLLHVVCLRFCRTAWLYCDNCHVCFPSRYSRGIHHSIARVNTAFVLIHILIYRYE